MRLRGKELKGPNTQTIVLPRDPEPIVLTAQAVLDYDLFDQLCPRPTPPIIMKKGGIKEANTKDARFLLAVESYGRKRIAWIVIESLRLGTPDLTWDEVDYGNPNTWEKYLEELKASGFSWAEVEYVIDCCMTANALNESKLEAARESFLLSLAQEAIEESSSQPVEQPNTPSGEPANG